jgi:hypothetical protein
MIDEYENTKICLRRRRILETVVPTVKNIFTLLIAEFFVFREVSVDSR